MSKALVVGGTGLLGGAAALALEEEGFDVVCLTRGGGAPAGTGVAGDVRMSGLGLDLSGRAELQDVTHVVSCFGSVDWRSGPRLARDLHLRGTRSLLEFAAGCPQLERFVHASSILALGRAEGELEGEELELGQGFRSWYDYGKFLAEREVRGDWASRRTRCRRRTPGCLRSCRSCCRAIRSRSTAAVRSPRTSRTR
jgi:nucleoside-diphosphate-sugar epimerase